MPRRDFRVVTHRTWLAELYAERGGRQDFGFDINPHTADDTLWWAPGDWVLRAADAGVRLPLMTMGPRFMAELSEHHMDFTSRRVVVAPAVEAATRVSELGVDRVHVKLPETKDDEFPAETVLVTELEAKLASPLIGDTTLVQLSEVVDFRFEARFFISNRVVGASSPYRYGDVLFGDPDWDTDRALASHDFDVAADLASRVPRRFRRAGIGHVLDVGVLSNGEPAVVEANAAWSSNPYDAGIDGAYRALVSSHDFERKRQEWWFGTEGLPNRKHRPLRLTV